MSADAASRIHVGCRWSSRRGKIAGALIDELRISNKVLYQGKKVGQKVFDPPKEPYTIFVRNEKGTGG